MTPLITQKFEPTSLLRQHVKCLWTLEAQASTHNVMPVLPDTNIELIFNDGALRPFAEGKSEMALYQRAATVYALDPNMLDFVRKDHLLDGFDLTQALERITCPTLIVRGEWDKGGAVRDEDADYAKQHLRNVVIEQIAGADHALNDNHATETLARMTAFLETLEV